MATDDAQPTQRNCGTMQVHERLLRTSPGYVEARANSENHAWRAMFTPMAGRTGCTRIPVVVHVVHKTTAQNVSDAQITSQIDVLNADFRKKNSDVSITPTVFQSFADDARIEFELASTDPDGNPTNGIVRKKTTQDSFSQDDGVKSSATGGSDAWPADKYLNIWVCQLSNNLLGYAQFPGGPAATDGVVILHTGFGTTGSAAAPFDKGRTTTHEIGHWLNLRHIWGDDGNGCSGDDFVVDTPNQGGPNTGVPAFPRVSCSNGPNGDMFMNYMDYTDDAGMVMFTAGQVTRMQAALDSARSSIGTSIPCATVSPPPCPPCPPPCRPCPPCVPPCRPCGPPPPCRPCPPCVPPPPCVPCRPCVPPPPCRPCIPPPCRPCVPPPCRPCVPPPPCQACGPCVVQPAFSQSDPMTGYWPDASGSGWERSVAGWDEGYGYWPDANYGASTGYSGWDEGYGYWPAANYGAGTGYSGWDEGYGYWPDTTGQRW